MSETIVASTAGEAALPNAPARYAELAQRGRIEPPGEYNFSHFRTKHLVWDAQRTARAAGVRPGELAPDFALPRAGGGTLRLSELHGRPVVLHFGSFS